MGFDSKISLHEMHVGTPCIHENLLLFLKVNFTKIKVSMTLFAFLYFYTQIFYMTFLHNKYVIYQNGSVHEIFFQVRVLKNNDF